MRMVDNRDMTDLTNYQEARIECLKAELARVKDENCTLADKLAYTEALLSRVLEMEFNNPDKK